VIGNLLGRLQYDPVIALHPFARPLVVWLVAAVVVCAMFNLNLRGRAEDSRLERFHTWLAGLQVFLAAGIFWLYVLRPPSTQGLGGYTAVLLMLVSVAPSALLGYSIFRFNFLDLRVQRNLVYSLVSIFALLLYLNVIRRLGGYLEGRNILPSAVTEGVMIFVLVVLLEPVKKQIDRLLHAAFVSELGAVQRFAADIQEFAKQKGDVEALKRFVAERAPSELGLQHADLRLATEGSEPPRVGSAIGKLRSFPIRRGNETIGFLDVMPVAPEPSGDQFGALEFLADQLAAAVELCQLIADKVQLERALAEKAKLAFLGEMATRIAHNVKNPLSSVKTLVQLLEEDASLPERVRQDCRMVITEIDRLNHNISQVLRYAKPARDADRPVDLVSITASVLGLTRAEAERRGVKIEFTTTLGSVPVQGGEEVAVDIVSNLIVNALEASLPGGTVRVRIAAEWADNGRVMLSVEDDGPGVSPELRERIFQPFFTTRPGGTGLGLAIVARRTEEIGGEVECLSPREAGARGARFVVRFRPAH